MRTRSAPWWLWGGGVLIGGICIFAISTAWALDDLARGAAVDAGGPQQAHDRTQSHNALWVHLAAATFTCAAAILVLKKAKSPRASWKRADVALGTLSLVALESVAPIYCVAIYYDNMQIWSQRQAQGGIFLVGVIAGAIWGVSRLTRLAVATMQRTSDTASDMM